MALIGNLIRSFVEKRSAKMPFETLREAFITSAEPIAMRIQQAADTPRNRAQAGHVIGIERWGAHRLQTALGAPFILDEYDAYRPDAERDMPTLAADFRQTRVETLSLVDELRPLLDQTVRHNDLGEMSVRAWLMYLSSHAEREVRRIA